jgi:hypothetical protein
VSGLGTSFELDPSLGLSQDLLILRLLSIPIPVINLDRKNYESEMWLSDGSLSPFDALSFCWRWSLKVTSPLLVGLQNGTTTLEINLEVPQKIRNRSTWRPSYTSLGNISKRCPIMSQGKCSTMFIVALFVIANSWKQPRCPTTEEWIQKMWFRYTMEYYSAI